MYVNWKEIPTTWSIPSGDITSTYMTLGVDWKWDSPFFYNGNMCLLRPYNRVLSNSEIQALYQEGLRKLWPTVWVRVNWVLVYSLPNLEQGKVLEISKPQVSGTYYDQTWSWHNGTATDVSDSTIGQANVMSFNESSSILTLPTNTLWTIGTQDFYVSWWYYLVDPWSWNFPMLFASFDYTHSHYYWPTIFFDPYDYGGWWNKIAFRCDASNQFFSNTTASSLYDWRHHIVMTRISWTLYLYINWNLDSSWNDNTNIPAANLVYICTDYKPQRRRWKTWLVRAWVWVWLSPTEVQQLYYAQKGNFIN